MAKQEKIRVQFCLTMHKPFIYDMNLGHLVIAIDDNSGTGSAFNFTSSDSIMNRSLVFSDNSVNPDPMTPANGVLKKAYPNMRFSNEFFEPYGMKVTTATHDSGIGISDSFHYSMTVQNKGLNPDTYTFTTNGAWEYQFRNASDTKDITSVSINVGESKSFWLKVTVPSTGVSEGDIDSLRLTVVSHGNPQRTEHLLITSSAMNENTVEIQKDKLEDDSLPVQPLKTYTYSQSIYSQGLINRSGVITSIAFQYNGCYHIHCISI